jgi:hypothetical protein
MPPLFFALPQTLSEDDIEYLKKKDALSLPPRQLQEKLFESYTRSVYPHFPFLDLRSFVSVLNHQSPPHGTSLLLFQAVMLAGCDLVSLRHLRSAGFQTRAEAQEQLYHRVRVWLFHSDIPSSPARRRPVLTIHLASL